MPPDPRNQGNWEFQLVLRNQHENAHPLAAVIAEVANCPLSLTWESPVFCQREETVQVDLLFCKEGKTLTLRGSGNGRRTGRETVTYREECEGREGSVGFPGRQPGQGRQEEDFPRRPGSKEGRQTA